MQAYHDVAQRAALLILIEGDRVRVDVCVADDLEAALRLREIAERVATLVRDGLAQLEAA